MVDIGGNFAECVVAATVDGTPFPIQPNVSRATLDAMITPNGKEPIDAKEARLP